MLAPRRIVIAAAVVTAVMTVAAVAFLLQEPTRASGMNLLIGLAVSIPATVLGIRIATVTDTPRIGALLCLLGAATSIVVARESWSQALAQWAEPNSWGWLVAVLAEGAWWVVALVALLLLHFPTGRLPSERWRPVPPLLVGSVIVVQVYGALESAPFRSPLGEVERPFGPPPLWLDLLSLVAFVLVLGLALACTGSLVIRFGRSSGRERNQIKWLALAGLGVAFYPLLCLTEILVWGEPTWFSAVVGVVALTAVPTTTAIAVLRPDLYDVDKALSSVVTWAAVIVVLLGLYAAIASTIGVVVGQGSALAAAAAGAAAAFTLLPLYRWTRVRVDARMYPLRRRVFADVDTLYRDVSAGRAEPEQLESSLRTGLRDPGLRIGYLLPGSTSFVDTGRTAVTHGSGTQIRLNATTIGILIVTPGTASAELMRDVAERCTTLVEMVRLRLEVSAALDEVAASRARLVQIGFEERRRLEQDLHDGAQQRLVSLGMSLRLAQRHLNDGTVDLDGLLDESVAELATAVAELRQIAHGIRPSSLDDGLPAALARLVRSLPVAVEMDVDPSPLPDDVATTAYFVASEAVANAIKHAEASRIVLQVERRDGRIVVRVSDDGRGGAVLSAGSGLNDRIAALGGSLRVASDDGRGTTIEAELPCAS